MSLLNVFLISLVSLGNVCSEAPKPRLVNIEQGPIRGYKAPGEDHYVFYGIPYATAPRGTQRFQVNIIQRSCG